MWGRVPGGSGRGRVCCHLSCPLQSFKASFVGLTPWSQSRRVLLAQPASFC